LLTAAELAVAIVRDGRDLLRESTLDGFRRGERQVAFAASLHIVSVANAER
jgi:hypothetical protein